MTERRMDSDAALERWLREEVGPAYDAMQADPSRGVTAADVFADIRKRHAARSEPKPANTDPI